MGPRSTHGVVSTIRHRRRIATTGDARGGRMRMFVCVAAAAILFASPAVAGLCDTVEKGTYLSNVCWLVNTHANNRVFVYERRIVEADEENCTITLVKSQGDENPLKIYFNRANLRDIETRVVDGRNCLYLYGEKLVEETRGYGEHVALCGRKPMKRVEAASINLYTKYCTGMKSEF